MKKTLLFAPGNAILIKKGSLVGFGFYDLNYQINNIHLSIFMFKYINNLLPLSFINMFQLNGLVGIRKFLKS